MPLRAKVTNRAFVGTAQMSDVRLRRDVERESGGRDDTASSATWKNDRDAKDYTPRGGISNETIKELPGDDPEDVLFDTLFGLRTIELNRPRKFHSLNASMIRKIVPRLQEWQKSDMANVVVIKGAGPKAFCAGGDVAALAENNKTGEEGMQRSTEYFELEYKLDHYIATYQKPYVAFMDGITMGGGVGLSVHAPFRIATERTVFAMPETTIGFFPDVGTSFFLPRMNGAVGTYLALTSTRLTGVNVFYSGIATHYLHSTSLPTLERRLAELRFEDYQSLEERQKIIDSTIEEFCTGLPHDQPMLLRGTLRKTIDRIFSKPNVPEILSALEAVVNEGGEMKVWAQNTLETLHQRSPTSVYVTLRQMQLGKSWTILEAFRREAKMAEHFMHHPDFIEGVDALLIRKTKDPKWSPASLEEVKPDDNIADPFFLSQGAALRTLSPRDYRTYPHLQFSVPNEAQISKVVNAGVMSSKEIINHFVNQRKGKQGVREIVQEVLQRMTTKGQGKSPQWVSHVSVPERPEQAAPRNSAQAPEQTASRDAPEDILAQRATETATEDAKEPSASDEKL